MAFEPFNSVGGYTLGIPPIPVINENGVATLNGLQVSGLSNLGSVGNVIILGGDNGYFLQTDGEGRLTWAPGGNGGGGNGSPGGSNTQVQYNNAGNFGGDAGFTYNSITNVLSVSGNIISNNFIGTGNITIANINANGNVTANYLIGNGSQLTGITATTANFANYAGNVTVSSQPNITSVGTLLNLNTSGNVTATANIIGANVTANQFFNALNANITGTTNLSGAVTVTNTGTITSLGNVNFTSAPNVTLGSGSYGDPNTVGQNQNDTPSRAIYSQYKNQLLPPTDTAFTFGNDTPNDILVVNVARARFRQKIDPGNWELRFASGTLTSGATSFSSFIDNSGEESTPTLNEAGRVIGIYSGSGAVTASNTVYGLFYPDHGVFVFNATRLKSELGMPFNSSSAATLSSAGTQPKNSVTASLYISASSYFAARSEEKVTSTHYFVRVTNQSFNFSNNPYN